MEVSKVKYFEELPTPDLKQRFYEEWERVSQILVLVFPLSNESLKIILQDLMFMHEELKKRKEQLYT